MLGQNLCDTWSFLFYSTSPSSCAWDRKTALQSAALGSRFKQQSHSHSETNMTRNRLQKECLCTVCELKYEAGALVCPHCWERGCQAIRLFGCSSHTHGGGLVTKSCPTLAMPWTAAHQAGPSVHGILQARILEWVAFSYFRGSSRPSNWTHVSHVSCIARGFFFMKPLGKPFMSCQRAFLVCKGMLNHSTGPQRAFRHMLNSHFKSI